jgi:hypothetical protein
MLACAFLVASGCANDARSKGDDPLTGGGPAIPAAGADTASVPARGADPATATAGARSGVPALPVPSSATSNAALAGGAFQPLDPTRELRIGDRNATPASWRGPADGTKATLETPRPVPDRAAPGQPSSLPTPTARPENRLTQPLQPLGATTTASADALLALLQARGVTWHRLETSGDNGEWKYVCSVPNANNPNIRRMYEASGRDPRTAMSAVLNQMDQERR